MQVRTKTIPLFSCIICLILCSTHAQAQSASAPPAALSAEAAAAVDRVLKHPRDEEQWGALKPPRIQDEVWPVLVKAVTSEQDHPLIGGFILPDNDPCNVLEAMAHINGPRSADRVLRIARESPSSRVRTEALRLIRDPLKLQTPEARKITRAALADPSGEVVVAALETIAELSDSDAGPAVLDILRHPPEKTWETREHNDGPRGDLFTAALHAIGRTSWPDATEDLIALTIDPSAKARANAATSLGSCTAHDSNPARHAQSLDCLVALMDDCNESARYAAAEALADLGDKRSLPVLAYKLRRDGNFDPQCPSGDYLRLFETVRRLEKLTGADYASSLGENAWDFFAREDEAEKSATVVARVRSILADLKKRGISAGSFPRLPETLTDADKKMFDDWFDHWLIDPRGGTQIRFDYPARSCWGGVGVGHAHGWLFPAADGKPARVVFNDGFQLPSPAKSDSLDLAGDARRTVAALRGESVEPPTAKPDAPLDFPPGRPIGASSVDAAWLYRLGHEKLAAQLLFISRGTDDTADGALKSDMEWNAWNIFDRAVNAYIARDDDTAYAELLRLRKLYPAYLDEFGSGSRLLTELERRRTEGTFVSHTPPATMPADDKWPAHENQSPKWSPPRGFDQRPVEDRVHRLIQELQEVDRRQMSQPGGVDVSSDPRVEALVAIGDSAVPALIDCIDTDKRLTRSVSFWRDFSRHRTLVAVSECALSAVQSIVGFGVFEPASTGDNFTSRGDDAAHQTAQNLRAYWAKYGKLPYNQRMMVVLTDPKSSSGAAFGAAAALAHANEERRFGTMVWTGASKPKPGPNPVINQFQNPTVAEAILAAMDREIAERKKARADKNDDLAEREIERTKDQYADLLITLQDRRISPALLQRYSTATEPADVRRWALACYALAEERPMVTIAQAFQAGTVKLGKVDPQATDFFDEPGNRELTEWLACLEEADNAICNQAIDSLAEPRHPYHAQAAQIVQRLILSQMGGYDRQRAWLVHPVVIQLARPLLDDKTPTDARFVIRNGDRVREAGKDGFGEGPIPATLSNPADRREEAPIRRCDIAARSLSAMLVGAPAVHPLFKDADARLGAFRDFIDRYASRFHRLPYAWGSAADLNSDDSGSHVETRFIPDVLFAGRVATPDDVAAHRALFSLNEPGAKPDVRPLPMTATLTRPGQLPEIVLIVQAERDSTGKMHYGVIGRHKAAEEAEDQLSNFKPIKSD